ncbi:uncharacterized protein LOC141904075 [Tubulanus polymorphus]|uniref:uncharacterized protein LOC141904075 n=1 Tax=Tubulanus polymorphus TaxID=672921 RepID=UPI003DA55CF2
MGVQYGALNDQPEENTDGISPDEIENTDEQQEEVKKPTLSCIRIITLNVSWFGINLIYLLLSVEVIPAQILSLVGPATKGRWFGGIVASGAVIMFISGPLIGMISDRLTSKFGRRRPIMFFATISICFGMAGMALSAPNVVFKSQYQNASNCVIDLEAQRCRPFSKNNSGLGLGLGLGLPHVNNPSDRSSVKLDQKYAEVSQPSKHPQSLGLFIVFYLFVIASFICISVPYNALIADKSHPEQRGLNSGVMGAMILFGNISGAGMGLFFPSLGVPLTYAVTSIIAVTCILTTLFFIHEDPATVTHKPCNFKSVFYGFWSPLKEHDFRWVFITRLLMQQGVSTVVAFLEFWLADMVYIPHCWGAARAVALVLLPMLITAAISSICGGLLSDRLGKRKVLVIVSAVLMCIVSIFLSAIRGQHAYYIAVCLALVFGLGFGCYQSVDFALVMDVLPVEKDKAKDIAVWHQALVLPQALATPVGGILLDLFERVNCHIGLGYIIIFLMTAVYFLLSGIFVIKIRGVR